MHAVVMQSTVAEKYYCSLAIVSLNASEITTDNIMNLSYVDVHRGVRLDAWPDWSIGNINQCRQ